MFFFIDENTGYERPRPRPRQSAHKYIGLVNVGFVQEEQKRDRKLAENEEHDYLEPVKQYDDTAAKPTQNIYDYIDEGMTGRLGLGIYLNRQTTETELRSTLCSCLRKYKIIVFATIVNIVLVTVTVGIVLGLILPARSNTDDTSGNESIQTTARSALERSTSHDGISLTGEGTEGTVDDEPYNSSVVPKGRQTTEDTPGNESDQVTTSPMDGQATIDPGSNPKGQDLLVIIGGRTYNRTWIYYDTVQIYTVNDGHVTWNKYGTPAPYHWYWSGIASSGGNICIAGGWARDSDGQLVELYNRRAANYNVRDDRWGILPNKTIYAKWGPVVYVINNHLYVADGDSTVSLSNFSKPTEKLDLSNVDSGWIREQAEPTHNVLDAQAVVIRNTAYICAGSLFETKTVISWTYGQPAWTPLAEMKIARSNNHGTVTDGISNIWVVGGCDPDDCWPDGFIEHYNVTNNTWTKLKHVPDIESDWYDVEVCSFWQGYIYVVFSNNGLIPSFHVYNTQTGEWHGDSTELMIPVKDSMSAIVPGTS